MILDSLWYVFLYFPHLKKSSFYMYLFTLEIRLVLHTTLAVIYSKNALNKPNG